MAQKNAFLLSSISGAALALAVAPGCSSPAPAPATAVVWHVEPGAVGSGSCSTVDDTFQVGDTTVNPIVTASDGTSYKGVPVTVQCTVSQNANGFSVQAYMKYGEEGTLTISGEITVSGNAKPGTQTGIEGDFGDELGLKANMRSSACTVTFTQNGSMGIAPSRIWGVIDCPTEGDPTQASATSCDAHAEFLFENCGQ